MGELLEIFYAGLVLYFLYKLIFGLIIPISRTASAVRSNIKEKQTQQDQRNPQRNTRKPAGSSKESEYIDFEEVK